ncbi:hypothetical protein MZM54_00880 [[Brevibacterium] frigoritolerans]|nr:hypothetical protein [Peribacillus frigoritolerans]
MIVGDGAIPIGKEKPIRSPKTSKPLKQKKEKSKSKLKLFGKKNTNDVVDDLDEELSWDNFTIGTRDKDIHDEQKEMDEMFGFEKTVKDDGLLERVKDTQPKKKLSLEEQYGDLFSEDEKEEITNEYDAAPSRVKPKNQELDDLADFDNFQLGGEENTNSVSDDGDEAYDFLKNYDFESSTKEETLDDDIFERARNQSTLRKPKKTDFEEEWELEKIKETLPPLVGENKMNSNKTTSTDSDNMDDDDDDIFARLQRLSNMMDQNKK